ncbi:hypothetical protein ARGLB_077_00350 [Arthrobacter globiformis NBRC 12137]|uniref:Major facilitator superfamily transporter n=1 Tax=Arthrobacter globiformis (strain ATCC 8010 / DSM 20124 / JCM 1332 / NBRC 12137 / NCIMB 8907 / NRRL B-2979 / 168) TaxID=1077972 RepID=H0QPR7_ARTG1|nr:MFS transporter [Arthrobacter globiformis]GAB14818.1 hypothetical protein ARGLB_077_00350 [Arthrobacter globiformis NBRC 12137]
MRDPGSKIPGSWALIACIGLIALNMRGPFVAVAPVAELMQLDLGYTSVELGLLTGIPVLCFSLAAPLASLSARRLGAEAAITLTLIGVLTGVVVRSAGGPVLVMLGTVVLGVAITLGNIAVPLIIRRDFSSRRQGSALGIYTAALNTGAFITSVATAPLAGLIGWPLALAASAVFAVAALGLWLPAAGSTSSRPVQNDCPDGQSSSDRGGTSWITVGLTVGFASQAVSYYGLTAWLPTLLADELGMAPSAAGAGSSLFQILAIVGALAVPLTARVVSTTAVALTLGALWLTVPLGLLLAPELWWFWCSLGGIAQGGGITLIFTAIVKIARDAASAGRMSAVVQGVGYWFGAASPTFLGFVYSVTGGWAWPLLVILCSVLAFILGTTLSVRLVPQQK